jgi:hypothetical protein
MASVITLMELTLVTHRHSVKLVTFSDYNSGAAAIH